MLFIGQSGDEITVMDYSFVSTIKGCKYCIAIGFRKHEFNAIFTTISKGSIKEMKEYISWLVKTEIYTDYLREVSLQYCLKYGTE